MFTEKSPPTPAAAPAKPIPQAPPIDVAEEDSERIDLHSDKYPAAAKKRHQARYAWAIDKITERFVRAGRVIDFACGTGYGSAMLSAVAHEVYGRDCDEEAIRIANARHSSTLVNFKVRDRIQQHLCVKCEKDQEGRPMSVKTAFCRCFVFDAVVSIESIEHFKDPKGFLTDAFNLIMPHGLLILSTPLKDALGAGVLRSKFHLVEYSVKEINSIVHNAGFVDVRHDKPEGLDGFIFLTARRPA